MSALDDHSAAVVWTLREEGEVIDEGGGASGELWERLRKRGHVMSRSYLNVVLAKLESEKLIKRDKRGAEKMVYEIRLAKPDNTGKYEDPFAGRANGTAALSMQEDETAINEPVQEQTRGRRSRVEKLMDEIMSLAPPERLMLVGWIMDKTAEEVHEWFKKVRALAGES